MRVEEYITFRAKLKGMSRSDRIRRTEYCLERCRLMTVRRRLLGTLSKGYRQRVGLADAMIADPPIFILDEPTSGLDPQQIRETLALLKELGDNHTILLSTHILSEVEAICERVIIIANGRIALNQRLEEIESESSTVVEARGPEDAMLKLLQGIKGIEAVKTLAAEDGIARFEVQTAENEDVREVVGQAVAAKGWTIRRLERKARRLENAFFDVMRIQDPLMSRQAEETTTTTAQTAAASPDSEAITKK
jgi:ABC-2 type transport system ATP-binding protein